MDAAPTALELAKQEGKGRGKPVNVLKDGGFEPGTQAWAADPLRYQPGGGESVADVLRRVRRAWTGIASSADTTLLVTHAGPIRCLLHVALRVPILEAIQASIAYGSVTRIGAGRDE